MSDTELARPVAKGRQRPRGDQRRRELASLNAVAETLNRTDDLSAALTRVLTIVAEVLGLHSGWVWILDERGEYVPAAAYRLPPRLQDPANMTGWLCHCLETFEAGDLRGAANVNVLSCSRLWNVVDGTDGLRYHASIPIYLAERKIGVMNVAMPQWRELSAEELQFLYTVGYQVGLAVEHKRLLTHQTRLAQVEERNRLAREIHDTVAQTLAGLALQLEAADALIERDTARSHKAVGRAISLTHTALEDVRRSVMDLRAAPLEGLTLTEALRRLATRFGTEHGILVRFDAAEQGRPLPPRVEAGVYRVAQEALTNVGRHAAASSIAVSLAIDALQTGRLRLSVEDDGRGFESDTQPGHFGLVGMRERARLLGGTLQVASSPGTGTRVELDVPVEG